MDCKNCELELTANNKFCANCGGQIVTQKLTVKRVFTEFSERYLSFDNKFLATFKMLLIGPEKVVNGYLEGLRMRYVNPISYLIIAVTLSGINLFLMRRGYFGKIDYAEISGNEKSAFDMNEFMNSIYEYNSILIFTAIPLLALISKIVFYNKKEFNFAEHNLIYFYTYSQTSIVTVLLIPIILVFNIPYMDYALITMVWMIAYHFYALKRIFNLTTKQIIFKTLLFIPIGLLFYLTLILIFGIGLFVYLLSTGKLNLEGLAQ